MGGLIYGLGFRPVWREPKPVVEEKVPGFYGGNGTIHSTGHVDVVTDKNGKVLQVWFRCAELPFKQSVADDWRVGQMAEYAVEPRKIKGVVFEDAE